MDIPRIVPMPKAGSEFGYSDFDLEVAGHNFPPVTQEILLAYLRTDEQERLNAEVAFHREKRLEDYLVRRLIGYDDIGYDDQAELLYKLVGQMVAHLRSLHSEEDVLLCVVRYHERKMAELIHAQMQAHVWTKDMGFEVKISPGVTTLRENNYTRPAGEAPVNFRAPVEEKQFIRSILFGGFRRCLYQVQKFDSDRERRFAGILEDDPGVEKWFKPAKGQFQIFYRHEHQDQQYEPDFAVETKTEKLLCEPKRASEMTDAVVLAKARAAVEWCRHATEHAETYGGKPWSYLLRGAMERGHTALICEFVASRLAKYFDIPAPELAVVNLDESFARLVAESYPKKARRVLQSVGLNFGSLQLSDVTIWATDRAIPEAMWQTATSIFAFDALIQNPDRRFHNPNLFSRGDSLIVYDHESAFSFIEAILLDSSPWLLANEKYLADHVFFRRLKSREIDLTAFTNSRAALPDTALPMILAEGPAEWNNGSVAKIERHLSTVASHAAEFAEEFRRRLV